MFPFSRILSLAAAGALVAFTAASLPAGADDLVDNLGPVGPHEPILAWSGSKRVIAFYEPDSGKCVTQWCSGTPRTTVSQQRALGLS